ncbi:MAG: hypothetical protein JWR42_138, partial [Marmoricola sp.]|nr:hypothetical protein [Marmoricola sp.]
AGSPGAVPAGAAGAAGGSHRAPVDTVVSTEEAPENGAGRHAAGGRHAGPTRPAE